MSPRASAIAFICLAALLLSCCRDVSDQRRTNSLSLDERLIVEKIVSLSTMGGTTARCLATTLKATDTAFASREALFFLKENQGQSRKISAILGSLRNWADVPEGRILFPRRVTDLENCRHRWLLQLNRPIIMGKYSVIYHEDSGCKLMFSYNILEREPDGWTLIERLGWSGPSPTTCEDPDWTDAEISGFVPLQYIKPTHPLGPSLEPTAQHPHLHRH